MTHRDEWWYRKQEGKTSRRPHRNEYVDIELPKNSGLGVIIGGLAFVFGFALIWHIWWLALVAFIGITLMIIRRTLDDENEYTITAAELFERDGVRYRKGAKA